MSKINKQEDYESWAFEEAKEVTKDVLDSFYEYSETLYEGSSAEERYKIAASLTIAHAIHYSRLIKQIKE